MKIFIMALLCSAIILSALIVKVDGPLQVDIYNPYRWDVKLEVKCDYNWRTKKFIYHKHLNVPGDGKLTIHISKTFRKCQIWP